jgi:long-subunit fatty acid transport protein
VTLDGSALVFSGAYLSYKPIERLRIGGGIQALVGNFQSAVVFSASPPDRLISAPEDPAYDTNSQLKVGPIFSPTATFGIIGIPIDQLRLGASVQLPTYINAPAKVSVRFPSAAPFDHARQDGNDGHVRFTLPAIVRGGIEYRTPIGGDKEIRVEVAYVHEFWSMHDNIDLRPDNITLSGITGFPSPINIAPITLPRNFQDSNSVRLGGELSYVLGGYDVQTRLGFNYESSAIPNNYVSPLTVDSDKFTAAIGGSMYLMKKRLRLDVVYAHVFATDVTVDPTTAGISRVNPVQGNAVKYPEAINGGTYSHRADVLGVGLEYRFGEPALTHKDDDTEKKKSEEDKGTPKPSDVSSDEPLIDPVVPPPASEGGPSTDVSPSDGTQTTPPPKKGGKKPKKKPSP